jgi:hypothetical protein
VPAVEKESFNSLMTTKHLHCKLCLTSRTGDVLGQPCQTPGCKGIVEEQPEFSTLVDVLPDPMLCGRRSENPLASQTFPGPDHWEKFKSNGNRVCSYCGSLHPDDMFALVKACAEAPDDAPYNSVVEVEQSDKSYKVYVHQPGVRNAHEGGIKFYMQHLPRGEDGKIAVTDVQQVEYSKACAASKRRFERMMRENYAPKI